MRRSGEEVSVNDYLTSYLKNFKTNFNAQLNVIESFSGQLGIGSVDEKIERAKQSVKMIYESAGTSQSTHSKMNWKILERFCLRINEFIEYRVSKTKAMVEHSINQQIEAMCLAMHRVFSEINKPKCSDDEQISLSTLFTKIGEVENYHMARILKRTIQLLKQNYDDVSIPDLIEKIERLKEIKVGKSEKLSIEKTMPTENSSNFDKKGSFKRRLHDSYYASKIRPRNSIFQRMQNTPTISVQESQLCQIKPSYANSHLLLRNPQDMAENSTEVGVQRQSKNGTYGNKIFSLMVDIIEIGNDLTAKYTQESLMRQLVENNRVNQVMIHRYRKKANKIKLKLSKNYALQDEERAHENLTDLETRHKRSYTLDGSTSKSNVKKEQKFLGLPSLKRRSIKV